VIDGVVTVHPDRLYALGGLIPLDERVSWLPPDAGAYAPLHCYLLVDGDDMLLVDTGLPVVEEALLRQLGAFVDSGKRLSILLTRQQEFDSVGNLAAILCRFPPHVVHLRGAAKQSDNLDSVFGDVPRDRDFDFRAVKVGGTVPVGGTVGVEILAPLLRLLSTNWAYEPSTRTLFTSDAFSHVQLASADAPRIVDGDTDPSTPASVRRSLFHKFDYLPRADTTLIRRQLAEQFETQPVESIAPMYGTVLRGRDVVERHYRYVQRALEEADGA
jgi:flavorubredoxin